MPLPYLNAMGPDGEFELKAKDIISIVGPQPRTLDLFKKMKVPTSAARKVLIVGGGRTSIYLAKQLIEMGIKYKKKCIYNCQNSNILNFLILTRYLCYYEYKAGYKMSVYF